MKRAGDADHKHESGLDDVPEGEAGPPGVLGVMGDSLPKGAVGEFLCDAGKAQAAGSHEQHDRAAIGVQGGKAFVFGGGGDGRVTGGDAGGLWYRNCHVFCPVWRNAGKAVYRRRGLFSMSRIAGSAVSAAAVPLRPLILKAIREALREERGACTVWYRPLWFCLFGRIR